MDSIKKKELNVDKDASFIHPLVYGFPLGSTAKMVIRPADNAPHCRVDLCQYQSGWKYDSLLHFDIRFKMNKVAISFSKNGGWGNKEEYPDTFPFAPGQKIVLVFEHIEPNQILIKVDGVDYYKYQAPTELKEANFLSIGGETGVQVEECEIEPNHYKVNHFGGGGRSYKPPISKMPFLYPLDGLVPDKKVTVCGTPLEQCDSRFWVELEVLRSMEGAGHLVMNVPLQVFVRTDKDPAKSQLTIETFDMGSSTAKKSEKFSHPFKHGQQFQMEIIGQKDNHVQVNVDGKKVATVKVEGIELRKANAVVVHYGVKLHSLCIVPGKNLSYLVKEYRQAFVKKSVLSADKEEFVLDCARRALEKHGWLQWAIATELIQTEMNNKYGKRWHCFMAYKQFGFQVTHDDNAYIFFLMDGIYFVVFKSGSG